MTEAPAIQVVVATGEDLLALDKRLRDEMTEDERENYRALGEMARTTRVVEATNRKTGKRSRFEFAEHFNIGPGWQMWDLNDGHRIVSSFDLVDVEPIISDETKPRRAKDFVQMSFSRQDDGAAGASLFVNRAAGSQQGVFFSGERDE